MKNFLYTQDTDSQFMAEYSKRRRPTDHQGMTSEEGSDLLSKKMRTLDTDHVASSPQIVPTPFCVENPEESVGYQIMNLSMITCIL